MDDGLVAAMVAWRRDVHAHPELAFEETRTAGLIVDALRDAGLAVTAGLGGTGIRATLRQGTGAGVHAFRADMDALPMTEGNRFAHASRHAGRMHACGHDGHAAMLLGAALHLARVPSFSGTLHFLFQPAEEVGAGAAAMIDDGALDGIGRIDGVFGMHNAPGIPIGHFAIWSGPVMAASSTFDIRVSGQGGHAALPHQGVDCVTAAAQIVVALNAVVSRAIDPMRHAVLSVTRIHGGTAYNVLPDSVTIAGGVRCFSKDVDQAIEHRIRAIATATAAAFGAEAEVVYRAQIPPLVNAPEAVSAALAAATDLVGRDAVQTVPAPVMGSDDFACFADRAPGCYALLGNGSAEGGCMVHSPLYDFNDDALRFGMAYWVRLAARLMPEGRA